MIQLCETCGHYFDDEFTWTICPHGPLWAPLNAYCREHDLVNCKLHGEPHEYAQLARGADAAFVPTHIFAKAYKPSRIRNLWWDVEHWIMARLGFTWSVQNGYQRETKP